MLSSFLYFAGAFAMAWLVSGILLLARVFGMEPPTARLLVANGGALIACELFYRTFDANRDLDRQVIDMPWRPLR